MKYRVRLGLCALLLTVVGLSVLNGVSSVRANDEERPAHMTQAGTLKANGSEEMTLRNLNSFHFVQLRGGWEWINGPDGSKIARSRFNDALIEGTFVGSWLELFAHLKGQSFELSLDAALPTILTLPKTDTDGYFRLLDGLSKSSHHFTLRLTDRQGGDLVAQSLRTDGNWLRGQFSRRPRILGYGSSTIDFCGITWQLGQRLNWEAVNRGIGGTTVVHEGQYRVASDVISQHPETILINYGSNDWFSNVPLDQFKPAFLSMLDGIGRGVPNANIVVMGLFPRRNGNESTRPLFNKAIQEAIRASVAADHTRYVEVTGYNYNTGSPDGTHPNPASVNSLFVPQLLPYFEKLHPILSNSDDDN